MEETIDYIKGKYVMSKLKRFKKIGKISGNWGNLFYFYLYIIESKYRLSRKENI